jgi:ribosome-associated protein
MADDDALTVTESISIPRAELSYRASRAGGAGGQHVNTSSTRIEVLWPIDRTQSLDEAQRQRVTEKLAARIDAEGNLRVVASKERSQLQNKAAAEARLAELVRGALMVPKKRKATRVPRAAKEKRLQDKKQQSERKKHRGRPLDD